MAYQPLEDFQTTDADRTSRRIRDMPYGKQQQSLVVFPESLSFSVSGIGQATPPQTVLLKNTGYQVLAISEVSVVGDFELVGEAPTEIGIDEIISIQVRCRPSVASDVTGGIYIDTGNAGGAEFVPLSGSGTGELVDPVITEFGQDLLLLEDVAALQTLIGFDSADYQPLDADLTSIAALTTTAFGRSLLELADAAALRTIADVTVPQAGVDYLTPAAIAAAYQPLDGDLTAIAALTTTAFGRSLLELVDGAALSALAADLEEGVDYLSPASIAEIYQPRISPVTTKTASHVLELADSGYWIRMNVAVANDLTVPANATVAFPIGTVIHIEQSGAGQTTIVEDTGVVVNTPETLKMSKQFATAALKKVDTDEWTLAGYLEAAP